MSLAPLAAANTNAPSGHYTHSPACALVATHCACCGQPLVDADGDELAVTAPRSANLGDALYRAGVRSTWDRNKKVRRVATANRAAVWRILRACLPPGTVVVGTAGVVVTDG